VDLKQRKSLINKFGNKYGRRPDYLIRAPGRVNLLGAHVDYNEGWVLPGAIDRSIWLAAGASHDSKIRIESLDLGGEIRLDVSEVPAIRRNKTKMQRLPGWSKFPLGVAWVLGQEEKELTGLNAMFTGDIPIGAGVSSSAAVEIAFIMAWELIAGFSLSDRERAQLGQRVENEFLGVSSGIMDQYASVFGKEDHLILLDCRTIDHRLIPLPRTTGIIVADSGVRRELANSKYNLRRDQCLDALSIIQQEMPWVRALRDVSVKEFQDLANSLPEVLRMRAQHVVEECARVLEGVQALESGDLAHFGDVIIRSHISSRYLYEVSIEELDVLAEAAWETPGCYGARLTGAGFGGCVVAYVEQESREYVAQAMSDAFSERFGLEPSIFTCKVDDGASFRSRADY
jgi:galactokinase